MKQEIQPASRLSGTPDLPPDKSISHRAALFAALHEGSSIIRNYSTAADPQSTLSCLQQLGVAFDENGDELLIHGVGRWGFQNPAVDLDCGNSGTTMRLLSGMLAGAGVSARLNGDDSLSVRPMKRITDPLSAMGASILASPSGTAPLFIQPAKLRAIHYPLPMPSAQVKSAVLLAGLFAEGKTQVIETIASRDHTERMLGLDLVLEDGYRMICTDCDTPIPNMSGTVPSDFSAAAFWMVAAAILPGSQISLKNVGMNPSRIAACHILAEMGLNIQTIPGKAAFNEPTADVNVKQEDHLKPVHLSGDIIANCIDELPVLSVAMAFADGRSKVSGAAELRVKETDRIHAIVQMLKNADVAVTEHADGFEVEGNVDHRFSGSVFNSFHDHRIAMSSAILALRSAKPCIVEGAESADVSYPEFWDCLISLAS